MDDFPEDLAIRVRGVGKTYKLGVINRRTLRDEFVYCWTRLRGRDPKDSMGRLGSREMADPSLFHALDDVSFDIRKGETVGLIGRNGAGKSTMLKILARITTPTTGEAWIRGRVGSMLEVGTGFHPELTGRENIYLNGSILGMKKAEIDAKFDEIVEFSEIGDFLDTPVKRYSSGMYVKLAFSVAASLDTDVLLLDEVLAVGDADFQKKSLARMKEIAASGRTILFVSHSIGNVRAICNRCILFEKGAIRLEGGVGEVVSVYEGKSGNSAVAAKGVGQAAATTLTDADETDATSAGSGGSPEKSVVSSVPDKTTAPSQFRPGDGTVRAESVSLRFDDDRRGWNVELSYSTPNGAPWAEPRAGVAICAGKNPKDVLLALDSATRGDLPAELPSSGKLLVGLSTGVRFPPGIYSAKIRLWSRGAMADNIDMPAVFSVPPETDSFFWKYPPFLPGRFMAEQSWVSESAAASPRPRSGDGSVRADSVVLQFDGKRRGWNVELSYATSDGMPWMEPRAGIAIGAAANPDDILLSLDSATRNELPVKLAPSGKISVGLSTGVRFPPGSYSAKIRLWSRGVMADDIDMPAVLSVPPEADAFSWKHPPFLPGRFMAEQVWATGAAETSVAPRSGDGSVLAESVNLRFDEKRRGWNVELSYSTSDGAPWAEPRAGVAIGSATNPDDVLLSLDSATRCEIPAELPPSGKLVVELSPGVRFPPGSYSAKIRLWSRGIVSDDIDMPAVLSVSPESDSFSWKYSPFLPGRFMADQSWVQAVNEDVPREVPLPLRERSDRRGNAEVRATGLRVSFNRERGGWDALLSYRTRTGGPWKAPRAALAFRVAGQRERFMAVFDTSSRHCCLGTACPPEGTLLLEIPEAFRFPAGEYEIDLRLWAETVAADDVLGAVAFHVPDDIATPNWKWPAYLRGEVNLKHEWRILGKDRQ